MHFLREMLGRSYTAANRDRIDRLIRASSPDRRLSFTIEPDLHNPSVVLVSPLDDETAQALVLLFKELQDGSQ